MAMDTLRAVDLDSMDASAEVSDGSEYWMASDSEEEGSERSMVLKRKRA